ncbi:hypothetical protein HanLR1_Chr14g0510901 [Helianthus annuus]|nr:hypothetical protein HanLR1_Chr14g0510901 [Helianthus annuus]
MLLLIVGGKKNESKMDIKVKSISPRKKRLRENDSMATRVNTIKIHIYTK